MPEIVVVSVFVESPSALVSVFGSKKKESPAPCGGSCRRRDESQAADFFVFFVCFVAIGYGTIVVTLSPPSALE